MCIRDSDHTVALQLRRDALCLQASDARLGIGAVTQGGFVVINTGNVEDEDNAKLFYKGTAKYEYLTDLSGAQGIWRATTLIFFSA